MRFTKNRFSSLTALASATAVATVSALVAMIPSMAAADEAAQIRKQFPEFADAVIQPSVLPGLFEVMQGGNVRYVTGDGRYLIDGDLFDVVEERNITEQRRETARLAAVNDVDESSMIVFAPAKETKHTITVFTDIDCGYCRKLHREIDQYNDLGIAVRYMFFPRSGPNTESWSKAENVWCAKDRNKALTQAKAGAMIKSAACGTTPVAKHYSLGRAIGIRGTPAIVADNGELIPGYVPAKELQEFLDD